MTAGTLVRLLSGGPVMTVIEIGVHEGYAGQILCGWFNAISETQHEYYSAWMTEKALIVL